jgi:uncharacterized protein YndB with AHSA1/START domain
MTVTDIRKDIEARTMTVTAEFDAPVERAWQLWADRNQLERWWGPPTYPATFVEHDLTPGGVMKYFMTGPEGDKVHGWWRVLAAEAPRRLEFEDWFAGDDGEPNGELPMTTARVAIDERPGGGTRMSIVSTFPSPEAMEQVLAMGMEEGMREALGQIDDVLAAA